MPKIEAKCSAIVLGALQMMLKLHKTKIRTASEILIQIKRIYVLTNTLLGALARTGSKEYWNTSIKVVIVHYRRQNIEGNI